MLHYEKVVQLQVSTRSSKLCYVPNEKEFKQGDYLAKRIIPLIIITAPGI